MKKLPALSFVIISMLATTAAASRIVPFKIMALNGFPDIAHTILKQTDEAETIIKSQLTPELKQKKLLAKISDLKNDISSAKAELEKHNLPHDLFEEVELDLQDAKNLIQQKKFFEAGGILTDYRNAVSKYVWTLR